MLKASIWDDPLVWRFGDPKTSKSKLLPSRGMASNSMFWDPKTSNSKVLTSWGHLSGWLNAKNFDLEEPPGAWPVDVKTFEFEVLGCIKLEFEGFNILGPSVRLLEC